MSAVFHPDDFFEVAERVKRKVDHPANLVALDPSKVDVPTFEFDVQQLSGKLAEYTNNDAGDGPRLRSQLALQIAKDGSFGNLHAENITIAPSLTSASINVLLALKQLGLKKAALASPCYYATKLQMDRIGLEHELLPTYEVECFRLSSDRIGEDANTLWITNPIISLTKNFEFESIDPWLFAKKENKTRYLVIDEAVDCDLPARFDIEGLSSCGVEVLRLRSLFKQVSINGQRLAFIVSSKKMTSVLARETWLSHGGVDRFSISTAEWASKNASDYSDLKATMLLRCKKENSELNRFLRGSNVSLPPYENGYITSLKIDMKKWPAFKKGGHQLAREQLIGSLVRAEILPTLAPSMYFAHEDGVERLRLGYLGATALREKALGRLLDQLPVRV